GRHLGPEPIAGCTRAQDRSAPADEPSRGTGRREAVDDQLAIAFQVSKSLNRSPTIALVMYHVHGQWAGDPDTWSPRRDPQPQVEILNASWATESLEEPVARDHR